MGSGCTCGKRGSAFVAYSSGVDSPLLLEAALRLLLELGSRADGRRQLKRSHFGV
jgi:hypothetical protein